MAARLESRKTQEEVIELLEREGFLEFSDKDVQKEPYKSIYPMPACFKEPACFKKIERQGIF